MVVLGAVAFSAELAEGHVEDGGQVHGEEVLARRGEVLGEDAFAGEFLDISSDGVLNYWEE